jgi:sugar/nucleoside kinase (ribokinase family)
VLFVSEEDLGDDESQLARWVKDVAQVVVTHDRHGANIHDEGRWREIEAFPADDVDPTGAGDVFSAAYLVRYYETEDVAEAARFATAAAACSIEAEGVAGIADRQRIEERLNTHPEIVLA